MLTVILACVAAAGSRVRQVPFARASFWRGLYFPIQICAHSSLYSVASCHVVRAMCHKYLMACVEMPLFVETGLNQAIS